MGQTFPISAGSRRRNGVRWYLWSQAPPPAPWNTIPSLPQRECLNRTSKWEKFHPVEPKVMPKSLQRFPTSQDDRTSPEPQRNCGQPPKRGALAPTLSPSFPPSPVSPPVSPSASASLPPSLVHVAQINNFFPPLLPLFLFGNDVVWPRPPSRPPPPLCVA